MIARVHREHIPWHGAGLLAFVGWVALALAPADLDVFLTLLACQVVLWTGVVLGIPDDGTGPSQGSLWLWAVAARAVGIGFIPWLEDDWYRYLWDGFRLAETGNSYGVAPAELFLDPGVPEIFVPVLSGINNPGLPTIYGPVLELVFAAAYFVQPGALWSLKLLLITADLAVVALIGRVAPARAQWMYALCPLVVLETAFHAHPDVIGALAGLAAALAARGRYFRVAGALLACACAAKLWALLLIPWVLRSLPAVFAWMATLAALYLPFALNSDVGFASLAVFAREWTFNAPVYGAIAAGVGDLPARLLLGGFAVLAWLLLIWRRYSDPIAPAELVFGLVLLLSPVVNPWYLLWILPFAAVNSRLLLPWVAAAVLPLAYAHGLFVDDTGLGPYEVAPAALAVEWSALGLALLVDIFRGRRAPSTGSPQRPG